MEKSSLHNDEAEKVKAELLRRDNRLNIEKQKLELIEIEMNISKQQEEMLEKDYQETIKQKQETIEQYNNDLESIGNNREKIIAMISNQMKKNEQFKKEKERQLLLNSFNLNQKIEKMFNSINTDKNDIQITQSSHGFIVVLDESGSMAGIPFYNCANAIKEIVRDLKSTFSDDEFCMIQFGKRARTTIHKTAVQNVNEAGIGKYFNSSEGTDLYQAFNQVKEVLPLFESKVINIMFITGSGDSNTSAYLRVLRQIKQEYYNKTFQLFGLAFGSSVSHDNIKVCLQEVNESQLSINEKWKQIQSYFEVNTAEDLNMAFKNMFEAQSASIEELDAKDKQIRELIAHQLEDSQIMRETLLKFFDSEQEQLTKELEKLTEDNKFSQTKRQKILLEILNQKTERLDKKLEEQEKEMKSLKQDKKINNLEKINEIKIDIKELEKQREKFCATTGSLLDKAENFQTVKEYEEEICKLGFLNKNHYDHLKKSLTNADQIEIVLLNLKFNGCFHVSSQLNQIICQ